MRGLAFGVCLLLVGLRPALATDCLTNTNTSTATTVTAATAGFFQIGGSDVVRFPNPPGINNTTAVINPVSSGGAASGLSCGTGAKANATDSVAIGNGASTTPGAKNAVALGNGSIATDPNTVSVGSPGNPRVITNVAPGMTPTDAINNAQFTAATTAQHLQNIVFQNQINNVQQQVTTLKRQTFAGISMAMAAAALQTGAGSAGAGKVAIGMGGGEFGGTASLSAGIAYSPTKQLNFNAGVSVAPVAGMVGVFGGSTWTLN